MFRRFTAWFHSKRQQRRDSLRFEREWVVRLDDDGISASFPDGRVEAIAWAEVLRIAIETNDRGPWGADFWWLLEGETKRCAYPQGATGELEAMDVFPSRFPGFSHEAVFEANRCTSNQRFLCWERVRQNRARP